MELARKTNGFEYWASKNFVFEFKLLKWLCKYIIDFLTAKIKTCWNVFDITVDNHFKNSLILLLVAIKKMLTL